MPRATRQCDGCGHKVSNWYQRDDYQFCTRCLLRHLEHAGVIRRRPLDLPDAAASPRTRRILAQCS